MNKIKIFIDTTVFRKDVSLNSAPMHALVNLSRAGFIDVFTSEISVNEFKSYINQSLSEEIKKIKNSYSKITNYFPKNPTIDFFQWQIEEKESEIKSTYEAQWKLFVQDLDLKIINFEFEDAKEVMKRYFLGEIPYNSLKSRNDIPDAFIFISLLKISNNSDEIIFISSDNNLKKHVNNSNIVTFDDLSEFLKSEKIQFIHEKIDNSPLKEKLKSILKIHQKEFIELISKLIERSDQLIDDYTQFYQSQVEDFMEDLEIDYNVSRSSIKYDLNKLIDYSSEAFSINFEAKVDVELEYNLDRGYLKYVGKERIESFKSFQESNSLEYYEVIENKSENVFGKIGIIFEGNIPSANFSIENLKISLENIYST